ncbi:MAG: hypothetical protein AB9846_09075 [Tenuifilaceae bacterium]
MKNFKLLTLILLGAFLLNWSESSAQKGFLNLKGDYLGQAPSKKPSVFAPELISTGLYERDFAVSPDGNEIYYSLFQGEWNTIMISKRVNNIWQEPVVASFARDTSFFFAEPALSSDGNKMYFLATKPRENEKAKPGWSNQNIWVAERQSDGNWGESKPLPENINAFEEFYPSLTNDGTLYFCRTDTKSGVSQILRSKLVNGEYADPIILPAPINEKGTIFNACIAPDDSYLIGCVSERDSTNLKRVTYMLFFHNPDDTWSNGIDLVKELNLPCPNAISVSVSYDGKYLFFASTKKTIKFKEILPDWKLSSISKRRLLPGNGNADIYWMIIEDGFKKFKK